MLIILCCLLLIVIGSLIKIKSTKLRNITNNLCDHDTIKLTQELAVEILIIFPSVVLFIALILIPVTRMNTYAEIKQFESVLQTISNARNGEFSLNSSIIENAAMQQKIIDSNEWLANKKYWNNTTFDLWIPNEINNLSEIK